MAKVKQRGVHIKQDRLETENVRLLSIIYNTLHKIKNKITCIEFDLANPAEQQDLMFVKGQMCELIDIREFIVSSVNNRSK